MIKRLKRFLNGMSGKQTMTRGDTETSSQRSEVRTTVIDEIVDHLKKQLKDEKQQVEWHHNKWKEHERETLRLIEMIQNLEEPT